MVYVEQQHQFLLIQKMWIKTMKLVHRILAGRYSRHRRSFASRSCLRISAGNNWMAHCCPPEPLYTFPYPSPAFFRSGGHDPPYRRSQVMGQSLVGSGVGRLHQSIASGGGLRGNRAQQTLLPIRVRVHGLCCVKDFIRDFVRTCGPGRVYLYTVLSTRMILLIWWPRNHPKNGNLMAKRKAFKFGNPQLA